ncbi:MAG: glycosyl hydrolase [Christensenellales bacterium]
MKDNLIVQGAALSRSDFFKTIPEFGIMPFWFINGGMDYQEMRYQLQEYKAKGVPGIFFHSRFGTLDHTGYLTDDWFDRLRYAVETARELGLQIWVYDEYNWPSGTAGKEVMRQDPNLTQRYLELVEADIPGQYFTFMEGTDSRYNDLEQSEPVYACAFLAEDLQRGNFKYIDLMPNLAFDKVVTWQAPEGPWKLMYFIQRRASWYADVLNDEATDKFIALTHERYKANSPGKLSDSVVGFYTDEPAMHYFEVARDNYIIPWSSQMLRIFRDHNGYGLLNQLPMLYYDFGGDTQQLRFDFWSALTKQYEKTYFKKIRNWCDDNDCVFTGHLLFEEWLRLHARTGGNLFTHLRHLHMTGVDHLYPRVGSREMPDEHVALKIASSAAHQFGSTRLLCESMGGAYWDCTMERMKWIADWEYVLGVNLFNPHGFHYSIEGERKRDWPPSMFYQHTWWPQYKRFNDYVSRMGYLLSGGYHVAKIAVMYPINSIWANYTPQRANRQSDLISREFNWMADRLLRLHLDYDILDEDVMDDCELSEDGALCIRGERYQCLILPALTHIKAKTLDRLERFVQAGGRLLADCLLPLASIQGEAKDFEARVEALFGRNPAEVLSAFLSGAAEEEMIQSARGRGLTALALGDGFARGDRLTRFENIIRRLVESEINIDSDEVFVLHRVKDGEDFFFLCNPTHQRLPIEICLRGEYGLEVWDLESGAITPLLLLQYQSGDTLLHWDMQPVGSLMLHRTSKPVLSASQSNLTLTALCEGGAEGWGRVSGRASALVQGRLLSALAKANLPAFVPPDDWQATFSTPNALVIEGWKFLLDEDGRGAMDLLDEALPEALPMRMGGWAFQLPTEREGKAYPVDVWFLIDFRAEYLPDDLQLMIDGFKCRSYTLFLNGEAVVETPRRSYLDAEIFTVPLRPLQVGHNRIAIRMRLEKDTGGLLDLVKLIGTFLVGKDEQGEYIAPPREGLRYGDWCGQGYPYLSAMVDYTQQLTLPEGFLGQRLLLSADVGDDLFEVFINDQPVGCRLWQPYELDITPAVTMETFTLKVRVVNTIANLLEAKRKPSGLNSLQILPHPQYRLKEADPS